MTVIASFFVDAAEIPFGRALAGTDTPIQLTQVVPVDGEFISYFWKERDGDTRAFEQHARDHPAVAALEDLDGRVDASLYRIEWAEAADGLLDALREHDVLVEEATTDHGEQWHFRLRVFDQGEPSAFQTACFEKDVHIDIQRMLHNPDSAEENEPGLDGLTEKQREALELALDEGYFALPRENSATELADEVGITRPAFFRRLQRAQKQIFTHLLRSPTP